MNFLEAVKAMKEGKKVRRNDWIKGLYVTKEAESNCILLYNVAQFDSITNFEAIDWEIVVEKKTLSDKHRDVLCQRAKVYDYAQEDVKEAIKEFVGVAMIGYSKNKLIERAKEIFGNRLV